MSMQNAPLVSILIRSMDRPSLGRALYSAAAQTWPNLEIVVVAACGSAHRTLPETFYGRPLRLIAPSGERRLPRAEAANAGLDAAQGEWLNFLDDDDELLPEHVAILMASPRTATTRVIYSRTRVVDAQGQVLGHISHAGTHIQLYFHSRATTCATLFARSLVDDGVRFDTEFAVHEDHDFAVNCAARTDFCFVNEATCIWNAQAGESGCGFGANDNATQRLETVLRIRHKWAPLFAQWLADADALLVTGQHYLKGGDIPAAVECLERALALRPGHVNTLNLCGMAQYRAGNSQRAEQLLLDATQRLPDHRGLQENLRLVRHRRAVANPTNSGSPSA